MQIFALSLFNDIEISGPISLYLLCIDAAFNASNNKQNNATYTESG